MSARKPVRLLASGLTGRVYAVTSYDEKPDGRIVAKTKHDVTSDIDALLAVERERIAQAIEAEEWVDAAASDEVNAYNDAISTCVRIARTPPQ
jgi:hypothetical protein